MLLSITSFEDFELNLFCKYFGFRTGYLKPVPSDTSIHPVYKDLYDVQCTESDSSIMDCPIKQLQLLNFAYTSLKL